MCRQLQHNSGRLSGSVTADYVLQLKGSANDEPKVSTRAARHPERHAVSHRQAASANVSPPVEPTLHCVSLLAVLSATCAPRHRRRRYRAFMAGTVPIRLGGTG